METTALLNDEYLSERTKRALSMPIISKDHSDKLKRMERAMVKTYSSNSKSAETKSFKEEVLSSVDDTMKNFGKAFKDSFINGFIEESTKNGTITREDAEKYANDLCKGDILESLLAGDSSKFEAALTNILESEYGEFIDTDPAEMESPSENKNSELLLEKKSVSNDEVMHKIKSATRFARANGSPEDVNKTLTSKTAKQILNDKTNKTKKQQSSKPKEASQVKAAYDVKAFDASRFVNPSNTTAGPGTPGGPVLEYNAPAHHEHVGLPHETCGLTDAQISDYIRTHFTLITNVYAYSLYDLANSKLLRSKMKEYGSNDRPNNPHFTQITMEECTHDPELLARFDTAFTMKCKNNRFVIVVLFNQNPIVDACGCRTYDMHILKHELQHK